MTDTRSSRRESPAVPLRARLSTLLGRGDAVERAWLSRVDPAETGPASSERGFEVEVAKREEVDAADGSGMVIRFSSRTHRFGDADWIPLETTKVATSAVLVPAEFSAGLPIEQLAEAWGDYRAAVESFNERAWAEESQTREGARVAAEQRADTQRDQRDVADLLDEH